MTRLLLVVEPDLGVTAADVAQAWDRDEAARELGAAAVEEQGGGGFFPGLIELVVVPLAVNLASSVVYDTARRVVDRLRGNGAGSGMEELEYVEHTSGDDRVVVVRVRRNQ